MFAVLGGSVERSGVGGVAVREIEVGVGLGLEAGGGVGFGVGWTVGLLLPPLLIYEDLAVST